MKKSAQLKVHASATQEAEITLNIEQRIAWLSERIKLTESDKSYIEFQLKELAAETASKVVSSFMRTSKHTIYLKTPKTNTNI